MPFDPTDLDTLGAERGDLTGRLKVNRPKLNAQIIAAYDSQMGTVEISRRANMTRDGVRQLLIKAGRITKDSPAEG